MIRRGRSRRSIRRWLVACATVAVGSGALLAGVGYAHRTSPVLEQLGAGTHPRLPAEIAARLGRSDREGSVWLVAIEPARCDEVCARQRAALRTLSDAQPPPGRIVTVTVDAQLAEWLGRDGPALVVITRDGRVSSAVPRAADAWQLRQVLRVAENHPTGIPASWPR